ncbi:MAG: hypothetical protein SH857_09340 [Chitinophagales bacterium]|nr:hypothetical protein [Chitinophagales bacterium]
MMIDNNFWGTKSFISFEKGNSYLLKIRNGLLINLVFTKTGGEEIFRYKLSTLKCNPEVVMEVADVNIPETEFWLMLIAGAFFMQMILKENTISDKITMLTATAAIAD